MVIDMATGSIFGPKVWTAACVERSGGNTRIQDQFRSRLHRKILTRGVDRVPCLEEAEVNPKRGWAGLYEMTPDHHPFSARHLACQVFFWQTGLAVTV